MTVRDYITSKGIEHVEQGGELKISFCPSCEETKKPNFANLYVNAETGAFYCFKCNSRGGFFALQTLYGDTPAASFRPAIPVKKEYQKPDFDVEESQKKLLRHGGGRAFLRSRKLWNREVFETFKIGYTDAYGGAISIPFFSVRELVCVKFRKITNKEFFRTPGCRSTLFNIDNVVYVEPVVVTEGEFDAMAAWTLGFKNVVSLPNGASSVNCLGTLNNFCEVWIATDDDVVGDESARRITEIIGDDKCRRLRFSGKKDFNDLLIAGGDKADAKFD